MPENLYSILGLGIGCSSDDVKRAYRKLAKQYHPDLNKSMAAPEMMKRINAAYAILSDPDKRKLYDHQLYATRARPGTQSSGDRPETRKYGSASNSSSGHYRQSYNSHTSYAGGRSKITIYALVMAILIFSFSYLFILPFIYHTNGQIPAVSYSATGLPAQSPAAARSDPGTSATPMPVVQPIVTTPSPLATPSPTITPTPVPSPAMASPEKYHTSSLAPPMARASGVGIVTGHVVVMGAVWAGSYYVAICDADNTSTEYYHTTSGPAGYFQFAAVNNTMGQSGELEKRYVIYARNNATNGEAYSQPFGVEPYRIVSEVLTF